MFGVSQANRVLEFISVITGLGSVERVEMRTQNTRCFSNPFDNTGDGAAYIYINKKGEIKFGSTYTGAASMSEKRVSDIIARQSPVG